MADRTDEEIKAAERKAVADAISAEHDAAKKRLEVEAAERNAIKDLVADLSGVDHGSLTVPDSSTVFQSLLGSRALADAAAKVAPIVAGKLKNGAKVLVITDLNLAGRDLSYRSVIDQLKQLTTLTSTYPDAPQENKGIDDVRMIDGVTGVATAAAKLLPGLLSLISARRTITNTSGTADDDVAAIAVAGALASTTKQVVVLDKARLIEADGASQTAWTDLRTACDGLAEKLKAAPESSATKGWLAGGNELLKKAEAVLSAMVASDGAEPSALAKASLQEALHDAGGFDAVLVVKGGATSSSQVVDDRPLLMKDKISLVSTATVSYVLIDHKNGGRVLAGGLAVGEAQLHGVLGDELLPTTPQQEPVHDHTDPMEHGLGGAGPS